MEAEILTALYTLLSGGAGVLISWLALVRKAKRDTERYGESKGFLASDIGYIKAGVDDLKRESRETRHEIGELSTRVARCEESCKQAHKRVDEIHGQLSHG